MQDHHPASMAIDTAAARVLIVDDDEALLASMHRRLRGGFSVVTATSGAAALRILAEGEPFAVIVSDLRMPKMNGLELLNAARTAAPDTMRIMLTGDADLAAAVEAVNSGRVFRFLQKPCPPEALEMMLADAIREYGRLQQERRLALEDPLLGIANRRAFNQAVMRVHSGAVRHARPYALVLIDVDHFKQFNDLYGHPAGDRVLAAIAAEIRDACRLSDEFFRYGGEEIVGICSDAMPEGLHAICARLHSRVAELRLPHAASATGFVTVSVGGAAYDPAGNPDWTTVLNWADQALYQAKAAGRNRAVVWPDDPEVQR